MGMPVRTRHEFWDARMDLTFETETDITPAEFVDVLRRSTLAERRPVDEPETIKAMLQHADLIVTARSEGLLVGVSRAITDFAYCTYGIASVWNN